MVVICFYFWCSEVTHSIGH